MDRNKLLEISKISDILIGMKNTDEVYSFLNEIFTKAELDDLSKRWRILNMLNCGMTQREIAKELKVSLCKVTRGSKILKNKNSVTTKYLIKEKNDE